MQPVNPCRSVGNTALCLPWLWLRHCRDSSRRAASARSRKASGLSPSCALHSQALRRSVFPNEPGDRRGFRAYRCVSPTASGCGTERNESSQPAGDSGRSRAAAQWREVQRPETDGVTPLTFPRRQSVRLAPVSAEAQTRTKEHRSRSADLCAKPHSLPTPS